MGFLDYVNINQGSDSRFDFSNGNTYTAAPESADLLIREN